MSIVKDMFTEKDGVSFCPVRAGFVIGFVFILLASAYSLVWGDASAFIKSGRDWMTGIATYLTGGGAVIAGKNSTEAPGSDT